MSKPPVKAQQLADRLAERIKAGDPAAGEWLPPERQLAESEGAARATVRAALELLAGSGLVDLVQGSGARVRAATEGETASAASVIAELRVVQAELRRLSEVIEQQGLPGSRRS